MLVSCAGEPFEFLSFIQVVKFDNIDLFLYNYKIITTAVKAIVFDFLPIHLILLFQSEEIAEVKLT